MTNPFYLRVLPIDAPFCGREKEFEALLSHAHSNTNVVLYSPRRYGKTSLVKRVQHQLEQEGFIALYIDISDASSGEDVASLIARGIYSFASKEESLLRKVMGLLKSWRPVFSPDPSATGGVAMTVQPVSQKTGISLLEETMDSFDKLLQDKKEQFNIVIDEFQEIVGFRDGGKIEAILRKHIQHQSNCSYFFLGSRRRILSDMFNQKDRPFYKSSVNLELPVLAEEEATDFIVRQFKAAGKECPYEIAREISEKSGGYPYYVQRFSYALFEVSSNEEIQSADIDAGLKKMLDEEGSNFSGMERELAPGQKPLLKALAADPTQSPFAVDYQQKHRLRALGSIQNSLKKLESLDFVEKDNGGVYRLTDPIFALWINNKSREIVVNSGMFPPVRSLSQAETSRSISQTIKEAQVEEAMRRGIAEKNAYRSGEAVVLKAKPSKPQVNIFVSYAHEDITHKEGFVKLLATALGNGDYEYSFIGDEAIPIGEEWHDWLQEHLTHCDFGLLLLSTSFTASVYIKESELPLLREKCLPVALRPLNLQSASLKALAQKQIFFSKTGKSFLDLKGVAQKDHFLNDLARKIEERVKKLFEAGKSIVSGDDRSLADVAGVIEGKYSESERHYCASELMDHFLDGCQKEKRKSYPHKNYVVPKGHTGNISHIPDAPVKSDTVNAIDYIKSWVLESDVPFFALLGDFGTGKTFTCRMIARQLNALHHEEPDRYPLCIYIDLRMVATRIGSEKRIPKLLNILEDAIQSTKDPLHQKSVQPQNIIQLVRENRAIIFFDGLDEKTVHFSLEETNQFIAELWSIREIREKDDTREQGKVLISCRTHYFRDIFEQNSLFLGRDREGRSSSEYRSCTLLPFDDNQIREYLKRRLSSSDVEIEQIVGLFEQVHNLKELASRPYTLSLITEFIPDLEKLQEEGKPINTARLYDLTVQSTLQRDGGKHEFSLDHKRRLMKALALEIHRRKGAGMKAEMLEEWLDTWLYEHPVIKDAYSNMNRETLKKDLRTATFIIREQEKEFSFAHTSLQEYFLAGQIVDVLTLSAGEMGALAMAMPSIETLNFAVEMLALDGLLLDCAIKSIEAILEDAYRKEVSELAFALWQKLRDHGMKLPNPGAVHLEDAELAGWRIRNLVLRNSCFDRAKLRGTQFEAVQLLSASFRKADLINAEFLSCTMSGGDFSMSEAVGSIWRKSSLQKSQWDAVHLRLASFVQCHLAGNKNFPDNHETALARCTGKTNTQFKDAFHLDKFTGHSGSVWSCAISPDGKSVVFGSSDNTLKVWDVASGTCLMTMANLPHNETAAWDGAGQKLLSASEEAWRWIGLSAGIRRLPIELLNPESAT